MEIREKKHIIGVNSVYVKMNFVSCFVGSNELLSELSINKDIFK